jgi:thiamine-phosphate pyrophosphorylase
MLHVLTDVSLQSRFSHAELARLAADGGADTVQFRDKQGWETARLVAEAERMRERLAGRGVRLIVNDRADVAAAATADGVHLGDADLPPEVARRILGARGLIGRTVHDVGAARLACRAPIDYLGVGPVFGSTSKTVAARALGLGGLRDIVRASDLPVIAIGNIDATSVAAVLATGAFGVAVLSAVVLARDPAAEVARIRESIDRSLREGLHGERAERWA